MECFERKLYDLHLKWLRIKYPTVDHQIASVDAPLVNEKGSFQQHYERKSVVPWRLH